MSKDVLLPWVSTESFSRKNNDHSKKKKKRKKEKEWEGQKGEQEWKRELEELP